VLNADAVSISGALDRLSGRDPIPCDRRDMRDMVETLRL
jgi:hypothetical protein